MLEHGAVLDRYTVIDELGRGGMAVVYRVRHNTLGSEHALKILTIHGASIRERLVMEGRVQAGLRHPNIVAVTDVIDVGGSPGLVMEYVEGPSLEGWLLQNKPDLATAERLFRGVLAGVRRAHREGLVHRDLKPGNVLLEFTEEGVIPKVADFGLAKALEADGGMNKTRTGIAMGTPAYMAPEQIRDAKNVDERADMFSLGCILYELVVGQAPFEGPDVLSIFNSVCEGRYVSANERVAVSSHLDDAIQGCLQVDRERRIPSCDALIQVLDGGDWSAAYDGATAPPSLRPGAVPAGLSVAPSGGPTPTAPRQPSHRTIDLDGQQAPATSNLSLLPGIEPSASLVPRSPPQVLEGPEPRRRRGPLLGALLGVSGLLVAGAVLLGGGDAIDPVPTTQPEILRAPAEFVSQPETLEPPPAETRPRAEKTSRKSTKAASPKPGTPAPTEPEPKTAEPASARPPPVVEPETDEAPPRLVDKLRLNFKSTYRVSGDALAVWLVGPDGNKYAAGKQMPSGAYGVKARFESWDGVVDAGTVQVLPGSTITIMCKEALLSCSR